MRNNTIIPVIKQLTQLKTVIKYDKNRLGTRILYSQAPAHTFRVV